MKSSDKNNEKLEKPIIFWGAIGVAIGASLSTAMNVGGLNTIFITLVCFTIGCVIGYLSKKSQYGEK